jgi:hypothetical protein
MIITPCSILATLDIVMRSRSPSCFWVSPIECRIAFNSFRVIMHNAYHIRGGFANKIS